MKTLVILLSLICVTAFGQSKKGAPQEPMTPEQLQAAAQTNFAARCATDFTWRDITNKIAKARQQQETAASKQAAEQKKQNLSLNAGQATTTRTSATVAAARQTEEARKAVAALELKKLQIEERLQKLMNAKVK